MWSLYWLTMPLSFLLGWFLDRLLGDPSRFHLIVLFGKLVSWGERHLNVGEDGQKRRKSVLYNSFIIALPVIVYYFLCFLLCLAIYVLCLLFHCTDDFIFRSCWVVSLLASNLIVFYMLSGTTLVREVKQVFFALDQSLAYGRLQVARIVGRDTEVLNEEEVKLAALETLSENLSDGVVAPLFWFFFLGVPGILIYKMVNTQDSMIGYKNERYRVYGRFSALFDDVLNYLPARLTAFMMLLSVGRLDLIPFLKKYGSAHASPNSGYPEAALAGILDCRFGGPHDYFGKLVDKPYIGTNNRVLSFSDLQMAVKINRRVEYMMVALMVFISLVLASLGC